MQSTSTGGLTNVVITIVVIALFVYRMVRPQRIGVARLFLTPVFLVALTALSVWGNAAIAAQTHTAPASPLWIAAALVIGAVLGIPLGILRGRHSDVRATDRRGVIYVHSSPLIIILWVVAFGLRALIRYVMPHAGSTAAVVGDALLAFAVAALIASYFIIYQRYQALPQQTAAA